MANDVHMLIMQGTCAGEFWETVQHYESSVASGPNPVGTSTNLINGFLANCQTPLQNCIAADCFITGYKAKRVNNGGGPTVMFPQTPAPGAVAGTSVSSALAYCITTRFSNGTAWRTGRWFIPGIPESVLTGNGYSAGGISNMADFIDAMQTFSEGGNGFVFGTWSELSGGVFHSPAYVALSPKIGIQKRRLLPVM